MAEHTLTIARGDYVTARVSGSDMWLTGVVLRRVGEQIDVRSPDCSARCDVLGATHAPRSRLCESREFVRAVRRDIQAGLVPT